MAVQLIPVGFLKSYVGGHEHVALDAGPTVAELIEAAGIPVALVALATVDGERVPRDYRPRDGEVVKLVTVMGGG
jgi:sulfur carrier protein ThiS